MTPKARALAFCTAAAGVMLTSAVAAQQRFTSRVAGVRVDVLVTDGTRTVQGLRADDFEVRDNGVVQQIRAIEVERVPMNVICVFDTSASVAGVRLRELVRAAHALIDGLRDFDRLALLSFATHVSLSVPLTGDRPRLHDALSELHAGAQTSLRDAVFAGLTLEAADSSRNLLIVFSDGDDTSSWLTKPRVIDAARRTDVVVYAVKTPAATVSVGHGGPPPNLRPPLGNLPSLQNQMQHADGRPSGGFLADITAETGGQVVELKNDTDLRSAFTSVLGEFRDRYVLSFVPTGVPAGGWHTLEVRVKGKPVKVVARRGYSGS